MREKVIKNVDLNISISEIFSNSHFKNVCNNEVSSFIDIKIEKYKDYFGINKNLPRKNILNSFYSYLLDKYRCEYIYKNIITNKILLGRHSINTSTLINEFRVGSSLADSVFINGESVVYEIKTELDSPDRLYDQINDYQKAFKIIYLVIHHSQIEKYAKIVKNSSIGLLALNKRFELSEVKKAKKEVGNLDVTTMFKCLRKEEYTNIIEKYYNKAPKVPNMLYFKSCLKLAKKIKAIDFHNAMIEELRKR
ncbi:MAG: sce7726 family protein, partial [Atribacterota bacterium]